MKSINEILKVIKKNTEDCPKNEILRGAGLCYINTKCYRSDKLSSSESSQFTEYLLKNKPKNINTKRSSWVHYWKRGTIKTRLNWLNKHIKLTNKTINNG